MPSPEGSSWHRAPTPQTPSRPARPRQKRGEGQWALGYREPLNPNEQSKKDDNPLNVRARIENIYALRGFDSIDPGDMRGRFRWWGLYTQRRPGIDGGKTATLEPEELDDRYFMLRVRIDGGQLNLEQLRTIADISIEHGRDTADLTDRQNIQLHWIDVKDVPTIWERLESVGLSTQEACGDCPRVILGSPVAGVSEDEIIDATPAIEAIESRYIGDKAFSNLPRKYKTAISGHPGHDVVPQINDIAFVGAVHPEHGPGFDVWVGGGLSTNPMLAKRLGAWVPLDEVPEVWEGITSVFRDYGYRRLRSRARLKFLIADWGIEKFREVLETEYLEAHAHRPRRARGARDPRSTTWASSARRTAASSWAPRRASAACPASLLNQIADVVEAHGSTRVRTTPMQKLLVLDVEEDQVESLIAALDELGLHARPVAVASQHDGLHGHRVLQARDRRDQGARGPARHRAREARARARHTDHRQRQRLPQLVRAHPDGRHRPQGHARARRERRPGRGLPGPPRRRARVSRPGSAASCARTR